MAEGLYTGVTVADGTDTGARLSAYRWHVPDPIPFQRSLRFVIEHAGWTYNQDGKVRSAFEERSDLFSSVAFWYQQPGGANELPEPPYGAARLPHGNAQMDSHDVQRYRCHTGHSFTSSALLLSQWERIEETLWTALRMFEERKNLLHSSAKRAKSG